MMASLMYWHIFRRWQKSDVNLRYTANDESGTSSTPRANALAVSDGIKVLVNHAPRSTTEQNCYKEALQPAELLM